MKLLRNMWMSILIPLAGIMYHRGSEFWRCVVVEMVPDHPAVCRRISGDGMLRTIGDIISGAITLAFDLSQGELGESGGRREDLRALDIGHRR